MSEGFDIEHHLSCYVCSAENGAQLRCALDAGADPNAVCRNGTALHRAAACYRADLVELLAAAGARPTAINGGFTPLHALAASMSQEWRFAAGRRARAVATATALLAMGDDPAAARGGKTAEAACRNGLDEMAAVFDAWRASRGRRTKPARPPD